MSQINFCLVFSNKNNTDLIRKILLNKGIVSHVVESPTSVPGFLQENMIDFIFLDFDFSNKASFELMDILKNNEKYSSLYVIATSFNTNENFIKKLQNPNIISFIAKPLMEEQVNKKINLLLEKFKDHFPTRKHIRITPSEDELMRIIIKLKSNKRITAKVLNISLGGLAALLYSNFESNELIPGKLIEHITFEANNKEIDVDAKIINKKENFIAVKFTHFYNNSNNELTKYIIKNISV